MGFKCGIVGLPNVGKSTLFNALTRAGIAAQNYPFCTIEPNVGIVPMPDPRLDAIAEIVKPESVIPTSMEFVDIAGLVAGAAQGEGLGNKFLAHIRETDAIAHIVRCFADDDVVHVAGKVSPREDIDTIQTELALADLDTIDRAREKAQKKGRSGDKAAREALDVLDRAKQHLDNGAPIRTLAQDEIMSSILDPLHLLTQKPLFYVANVTESGWENNPFFAEVQQLAAEEKAQIVPICASIEAEIAELPDAEQAEFLESLELEEPGLNRFIRVGYSLLGLDTFFTAGPKEVRAWTFVRGATAPQAAGCIHTDFERGFIRAEVIGYDNFIQCRGEAGAKEAGKWRLEGKDYPVQDGDVIHFRFNV